MASPRDGRVSTRDDRVTIRKSRESRAGDSMQECLVSNKSCWTTEAPVTAMED